jgi:hypothetical protein
MLSHHTGPRHAQEGTLGASIVLGHGLQIVDAENLPILIRNQDLVHRVLGHCVKITVQSSKLIGQLSKLVVFQPQVPPVENLFLMFSRPVIGQKQIFEFRPV